MKSGGRVGRALGAAALALAGLGLAAPATRASTGTWTATPIGQQGWVGPQSVLADGTTTHVVAYDSGAGVIRYSTCTGSCASWASAPVATLSGLGIRPAIGRDASGTLHVAWADENQWTFAADLHYATCSSSCTTAGSWTSVTLRSLGDWADTSMAVSAGGAVHIVAVGRDLAGSGWTDLFYASCASACGSASSWTDTSLLPIGQSVVNPGGVSTAVDSLGHVRASYHAHVQGQGEAVFYASCDSGCSSAASWHHEPVLTGLCCPSDTKLVVNGGGAHMAVQFQDSVPPITSGLVTPPLSGTGHLGYLACEGRCDDHTYWSKLAVLEMPTWVVGPSMVVDGPSVRIAYNAQAKHQTWLAACQHWCTDPGQWGTERLDVAGNASATVALAADGSGGLVMGYADGGAVNVARCASGCVPPPEVLPWGLKNAALPAP